MILGITGSSGAGKSTVCEILERKYSSQTINADKIAKQLSKQGTSYLQEIVQNFGDDILLEDGELNRRKLANIIYSNPEKRDELNNITFKYIKNEIKEQIAKSNNNIIAIDAPLLLEANLQEICDKTIAVISEDRNLQIKRIIKRDNIDKEHAIARLNAQHPNEFYIQNCDNTLINDETLEQQIEKLLFSEN
ncbi:MAG: dephospho-CoA kinase [Clostridia bacterium]|jgi:dephospho-CoA kinase|nr:dephospho-CoA kinase [Clostridia bacterium]